MNSINIFAVGFNATEELKNFIRKKTGKLIKVNERIVGIDVALKLKKSDTLQNKTAEITLRVPGSDLFARKNAKTFEEAVNTAIDALRRQQNKRLEKIRENKM